MLLEDDADAIEVVLRGQIEHGVVLVVKLPVLLGAGQVALHQVHVELPVRSDVADRVHGHEASVLQKPGIDAAAAARVAARHLLDHVAFEPLETVRVREIIDPGRAAARIDRAAHQDQASRLGLAGRRHQRRCRQHRHRRLADRDHVQALGANVPNELANVADVVVERERAAVGRAPCARRSSR